MSASTLADILLTPAVEWEQFAKEWVALGEKAEDKKDEVDELAVAIGSWSRNSEDEMME